MPGLRSRQFNRSGVVGAWVVVALLALIGIAALVIDLGRLIVAAQYLQNVADAAALAGAAQLPDTDQANARLQGIVQINDNEISAFTISTEPDDDVTFYNPTDTVPDYGALEDDENAVEVTVHSTVDYTFARIFGINEVEVTRTATALSSGDDSGSGSGGIFFAEEAASYLWGVVFNGSHQYVGGDIHSNTRVVVNGSHQTVDGTIEYRHQCTINGAYQDIGDQQEGDIEPYPISYEWDDYYNSGPYDYVYSSVSYNGNNESLPIGDWQVIGNMSIDGTRFEAHNSTFMVGGNLTINGSFFESHNCLFMVDGSININGAHIDLDESTFITRQGANFNSALKECSYNRDCDGLFCMAEGTSGIVYNGAWQRTEGILFAPNGPITYNGAHQEVYNGGLCSRTITVNGADGTFNPLDEYGWGGGSGSRVALIK